MAVAGQTKQGRRDKRSRAREEEKRSMEMQNIQDQQLHDDVLFEILAHLPSKSVLRCRAVCKRWLRITSERSFLAAHATHRPREMLILTKSLTLCSVPLSLTPRSPDDMGRRGYLCDMSDGCCALVASLDGLLLLQQRAGVGLSHFIVCNPITRQWTNLPVLTPQPCSKASPCGFYHHSSSGEYRLLCHGVVVEACKNYYYYYYILSAGAARPRRLACRAPAIVGGDRAYQFPVAHRGILYWLFFHPEATRTGKMLAYDTVSETFRPLSRPPSCSNQAALLELHGELCAAVLMGGATSLNIWVLQQDTSCWALRHQMVLPLPATCLKVSVSMAIGTDDDGAILVGHPPFCRVVSLCHLTQGRLRKQMAFLSSPTMLVFRESLLPHAFFHTQSNTPPRCPDGLKFSN